MQKLANKNVVIVALVAMLIMFGVVMFTVNPLIDNGDGLEVIGLQVSFDKQAGAEIVSHWNVQAFKQWIFTDYIYALCYTLFFTSLLLWLMKVKGKDNSWYMIFVYVAIFAGLSDWIENSLELWFLDDIDGFSQGLFWTHSMIATLKWLALPVVLVGIISLYKSKTNA